MVGVVARFADRGVVAAPAAVILSLSLVPASLSLPLVPVLTAARATAEQTSRTAPAVTANNKNLLAIPAPHPMDPFACHKNHGRARTRSYRPDRGTFSSTFGLESRRRGRVRTRHYEIS